MAQFDEHPTVIQFRERQAAGNAPVSPQSLTAAWPRKVCMDAGADDVGATVADDSPSDAQTSSEIRRFATALTSMHRRARHTAALAACLILLVFSSFILAEGATAESAPSTIHFRSPRGFSIVVPVYVNGSGPFDFLLDTGSTFTAVDPELLRSLRLDVIRGSTIITPTGKRTMPLAVARTVSVGPVTESKVELGVRDLADLHELDPRIHGVLGQNVLKNADYLIDNRKRTIKFDAAGTLLTALDGERVNTSRIATPDSPAYGSTAIRVKLGGSNAGYCKFLLDSGSASVVLFSDSPYAARMPKQSRLQVVEDDAGRQKYVTAYPYSMQLGVGSIYRDVEVYVAGIGSKGLEVEGLLPTAGFESVYISNSGSFVIFQPKRNRHRTSDELVAAVNPKTQNGIRRVDAPDVSMIDAK